MVAGLGAAGLGGLAAAPGRPAAAPGRALAAWPGGAQAAVSLCYDDGLNSQLDHAAADLARADVKATFFLTRDNVEARAADWVALAGRGHEIGNHTVTHPCDLRRYTAASFAERELRPMERYLDDHFGPARSHLFAYPCSVTDLGAGDANQQLARYSRLLEHEGFKAARTCDGDPNPNSREHARTQPFDVRGFAPTYDQDDPAVAQAYVRQAIRDGGWAVMVFHEVLPQRGGPGETSVAHHQAILQWIATQSVWCAPMGAVLAHLRA
jgi:peptidoglycan/xylan/chitin deacetylase (PgdA/CDA1 family)